MQSVAQSLAGRTALLTLAPFSVEELKSASLLPESVNEMLYKGSYPRLYDKKISPIDYYPSYIKTYIERDVRLLQNITNLSAFTRFLKLCAGRCSQILNVSSLAEDAGITRKTAESWLSVLEASYIIYLLKPYYKNFGKRIIKSPKMYFYDTGLVSFLLGINDSSQIRLDCQPENSHFDIFTFETDDNSVAVVDGNGLLHAVAPGKAKVTVTAFGFDYVNNKDINLSTTAIVNVLPGDSPNPMTAEGRSVAVKASRLAKKSVKIKPAKAYDINEAQGKLSYQSVEVKPAKYNKYFKVNAQNGTITVKKGLSKKLPKGGKKKALVQLQVQISDAGTAEYQAAEQLATVEVKVRK